MRTMTCAACRICHDFENGTSVVQQMTLITNDLGNPKKIIMMFTYEIQPPFQEIHIFPQLNNTQFETGKFGENPTIIKITLLGKSKSYGSLNKIL